MSQPNEIELPDDDLVPRPPRCEEISLDDCRQSGLAAFFRNQVFPDFDDAFQGGVLRDGFPFFRPGSISIWIGTMPNEEALRLYLNLEELSETYCDLDPQRNEFSQFATDLGFVPWQSEQIWSHFVSERLAPDKLLSAAPDSACFIHEAANRCLRLGIQLGNSAICCYNMDFHGRRRRFGFGALRFVGSFTYPGYRTHVISPGE